MPTVERTLVRFGVFCTKRIGFCAKNTCFGIKQWTKVRSTDIM